MRSGPPDQHGVGPGDEDPGLDRRAALARLGRETFDLVVIGGGITGAGVALDAAARGLNTALVERFDLASGTSSKSSKMVHGGLRYLQQHEFRLVYENLHERQRLLVNAPHLVEPLPFLIPMFGSAGVVNTTVAKTYSTALWLYDITGGWRIGKRHRRLSVDQVLDHMPALRADRLTSGFLYYDARADDARLTLTVALSAAARGAAIATYSPVVSIIKDKAGKVAGVQITPHDVGDGRDGGAAEGRGGGEGDGSTITVRTRSVVNAAGVWADDIRELDEGVHPRSIRPAKGVHITVASSKLACDVAAVIPVPHDRRSIFVVPWGNEVYLGTTDTDYGGPLEDPECTPEDVEYILGAVNAFVTKPIEAADVTGTWAGLRPLAAPKEGGAVDPGSRTADLSRRHRVRVSSSGLVSITGGKLTTYRAMAADATDAAVAQLRSGHRPLHSGRSRTKKLPLWGAEGTAQLRRPDAARDHGIDAELLEHLVSRYGGHALAVARLINSEAAWSLRLIPGQPYRAGEVIWSVRNEMAQTVADVLARRTRALLHDRLGALRAAPKVAELMGAELNWDVEEQARQVKDFSEMAQREARAAGPTGGP